MKKYILPLLLLLWPIQAFATMEITDNSGNIIFSADEVTGEVTTNATGNIGVGSTDPVGKMDVVGDELRVWTGAGNAGTATGNGDIYVESDLEVDGSAVLGDAVTDTITVPAVMDFEAGGEGYPRLAQSTTPPSGDCDAAGESGRLYFDTDADTDGSVYVCKGAAGWKEIDDDGGTGPWTDGTGVTYLTDTAESLGIGTTAASAKFHLTGTDPGMIIQPSNAAADTDYWIGIDANAGTDDDKLQIGDGTTLFTNPFITLDTSGNVGIGTVTPAGPLNVTASGATNLLFELDSTGDFVVEDATGSDTSPFIITDGGDVGIGTTTPSVKLEVKTTSDTSMVISTTGGGSTALNFDSGSQDWMIGRYSSNPDDAESFIIRNSTGSSYPFTVTTGNNIGLGTGTPNEKLALEGRISLKETTSPTDNTNYGKLFVKSADSKLYFRNDSGTEYDLTAAGAASPWTDGTGVTYLTDTAENLGIGTAAASSEMHITGVDPGIILQPKPNAGDTDFWMATVDDGDGNDDDVFQVGDGTAVGTNPFLTITTAGNVGVGSTNPTMYPLEVFSSTATTVASFTSSASDANIALQKDITAGGTSKGAYMYYGTIDTSPFDDVAYWITGLDILDAGSTDYSIADGSWNAKITVQQDGDTGIGTTSPTEKLAVEGRISLRETTSPTDTANYGKLFVKSSDSKLYFRTDGGTEYDLTAAAGGSSKWTDGGATTYLTANTDLIGIGTTTASAIVHLTDTDPGIILQPETSAGDTDFWIGVNEDADGVDDDKFQIGDGTAVGTNTFLTIDTSGNVGIGSTSPDHLLTRISKLKKVKNEIKKA